VLDIRLNEDGDIAISENGDISTTESVRQAVMIRLRWIYDEWRLGPELGFPWFEEVFIKNPNTIKIKTLVRNEILKVKEVKAATVTAVDCYTDDVLREIAENGFNAIWLHSVLANITQLDIFPEFGKHAELHIRNLSTLISRAAKYGIRVFLYFQPVRSVAAENREFWNRHQSLPQFMKTKSFIRRSFRMILIFIMFMIHWM